MLRTSICLLFLLACPCCVMAGNISPDGKWGLAITTTPKLVIENLEHKETQVLDGVSDHEKAADAHWRVDSRAFVIPVPGKKTCEFSLFSYTGGKWTIVLLANGNDKKFGMQQIWKLSNDDYLEATKEGWEQFLGWSPDGGIRWCQCLTGDSCPTIYRAKIVIKKDANPEMIITSATKELDRK